MHVNTLKQSQHQAHYEHLVIKICNRCVMVNGSYVNIVRHEVVGRFGLL